MPSRTIPEIETLLSGAPTARDLYSLWEGEHAGAAAAYKSGGSETPVPWLEDASLAQKFTAHALRREEFLLVLESARRILRPSAQASDDDKTRLVRVRMDYATALTRLGFVKEARRELEPCVAADFRPQLGRRMKSGIFLQLGHTIREEWLSVSDRAARNRTALEALDCYRRALDLDPDRTEALTLVASTQFILADLDPNLLHQARETARHILTVTKALRDDEGPRRLTTLAEATAHAVLGDLDSAARSFEELPRLDGITTADLADARFQAQFLAEASGKPRHFFKEAFPPLQLLVFSGHLLDRPGDPPRFPLASLPQARDDMRKQLANMGARIGLASASGGADLLFTEALLERGGSLHLMLPWSRDEFLRTSVHPFEPPDGPPIWEPLFKQALEAASTTREIGQVYEPASDVGWVFAMDVTAGIALHTARSLRLDVQPLVLWDGLPGRGAGGTAAFHDFWSGTLKNKPAVISLPPVSSPAVLPLTRRMTERSTLHQEVKSMLFADVVGYSKLTEKVIPDFIATFLDRLGQLVATSRHAPCSVNTWGDAIYAVFDFARDAGLFALELARMLDDGKRDWLAKGLYWETHTESEGVVKHPLNIRIGLHCGPVVMHFDPVVRRLGFTGAHVNRAARIEPVTEPGQAFASEEFVAMAELTDAIERASSGGAVTGSGIEFVCEYAGSMQLAKGYPGRHRIYRLVGRPILVIESLARAVHDDYCEQARKRGETSATTAALRPWDELSEDLKDANRAQVADIPNKLRMLGFELTAGAGRPASELPLTDSRIEELAIHEHSRWMDDRKIHGWTFAPVRDNSRKQHPLLVPWSALDEVEREKDRIVVRNMPLLIERAGLRVRQI